MADFKLLKEMQQAMQPKKTTEPYDTTAEVRRIEGKTAWVHIPGGVDETPVELTINAKEGDAVRVRVSGGQAWIAGNNTSPPTDDSTALRLTKQVDTDLTKKVNGLDQSLDQEELFKRITNNWLWQGIYLDEETGNYYFNATFIHAGTISADYIHGGVLTLGGLDDGNGLLETYNASGQLENRINNEGINIYDKGTYVGRITGDDDLDQGGTKVALLIEGSNYIEIVTDYMTRLAYSQINTSRQVQHKFEGDVYGDSDISAANIISRGKATLKGLALTDGSSQTDPPFYLCLNESFANGGNVGYLTKANMKKAMLADDSGWIAFPYTSAFENYATTNVLKYRKIGKTVEITGIAKPTAAIAAGADQTEIGTLPTGYRPSTQVNVLCQGSGRNVWLLIISTAGRVTFSRYRDENGYNAASNSTWLPIHVTFMID